MHFILGNQDLSQDEPLLQAPQPQQGQAMDVTLSIPRGRVNKKHVGADYSFSQVFAREQGKRRLPHQPLHSQGEDLLSSVNTSPGRCGHPYTRESMFAVCDAEIHRDPTLPPAHHGESPSTPLRLQPEVLTAGELSHVNDN